VSEVAPLRPARADRKTTQTRRRRRKAAGRLPDRRQPRWWGPGTPRRAKEAHPARRARAATWLGRGASWEQLVYATPYMLAIIPGTGIGRAGSWKLPGDAPAQVRALVRPTGDRGVHLYRPSPLTEPGYGARTPPRRSPPTAERVGDTYVLNGRQDLLPRVVPSPTTSRGAFANYRQKRRGGKGHPGVSSSPGTPRDSASSRANERKPRRSGTWPGPRKLRFEGLA